MRWLLLLAALPAAAEEITDFTLDNGMQVIVLEDHRAPVVTHMVWYRVGAADEPAGQSGIAHYLEHLMFKGTDSIGDGDFSRIVAANGGEDNAFTAQDYTGYFQQIAVDRLDLVMSMEADRMVNLRIAETFAELERDVVIEERLTRTESDPGAMLTEQRNAQQFLNHPYGIPIIGWLHEIETLDREAALDFYRQHYAPDNAILIVAGDVTPDQVRDLAEAHYGPIPGAGVAERVRPQEPPQVAPRRVAFADPRVGQEYVVRTYLAPPREPGAQETAAALVYLSELLGGSNLTSFLGAELVLDQQIALSAGAFYQATAYDPQTFGVYVVPVPGVDLATAEAAMDQAIADFLAEGPDPDALERLRTRLRADRIYSMDSQSARARRVGTALTAGLTVADVEAWPDILEAVTADDVMAAARDVLDIDTSVTGWLQREDTQ